jgi:hypothetical protein
MMFKVELEEEEWQRVMAIIANASWNVANPLLMKLGEQLQVQKTGNSHKMVADAEQPNVKQ